MVLLVLAVLWGIVLLPPALRNRAEARQSRSVDNFRKRLAVLAPPPVPRASRPTTAVRPAGSAPPRVDLLAARAAATKAAPAAEPPAPAAPPAASKAEAVFRRPSRAEVLRRRRQVFGALCLAAVGTLGFGLAVPGMRLFVAGAHLLVDVALAGYVIGLRRLRRLARERAVKVRYLPVAIPVSEPEPTAELELTTARSASL